MAADFKSTFKTFLQTYDEGASDMDAENPYKFQLTQMLSPRKLKEEFNTTKATVYYHPKENAWKELSTESVSDGGDGAKSHSHRIPDESQFGDPWSQDNVDNSPVAVYDCAIDPDLILWVWTEDEPYKVVSKEQPS